MSRGGVYAFNWAAVNPYKVAAVYVDNPVLDLKTWPAGLGRYAASPRVGSSTQPAQSHTYCGVYTKGGASWPFTLILSSCQTIISYSFKTTFAITMVVLKAIHRS